MKAKRLSLRTLARLSFHGFFEHPVRLVLTVFISLVSFVLMGTSVTLARYTPERAMVETYATVTDSFSLVAEGEKPLKEQADAVFPLAYGAVTDGAEYLTASSLAPDGSFIEYQERAGVHVQSAVRTAAWFPEEVERALGIAWCAGGRPQDGEVALSSCTANAFLAEGTAKNYEDVVGKHISYTLPVGGTREATVSGVYDTTDCKRGGNILSPCADDVCEWKGAMFVSEDVFWELAEEAGGAEALYYAGDHDRGTAEALIAFLGENWDYSSDVFDVVAVYDEKVRQVQTWCVALGAVLTVFSAFLLYQLIAVLLEDNVEMLGVLRMLGARGSVCVQIAMLGSVALGLFTGVLGAVLSLAGNVLMNAVFRTVLRVPIAVAGFDALSFLSIIGLGLAVGFLAALVPSIRLARRTPIQMQPARRA